MMSNQSEGHRIFISYASSDSDSARELVDSLRSEGIKTWLDSAEIQPGERWKDMIEDELRKARVVIVFLTRESLNSRWPFFEVGAAVADRKTIIPVLSKDVDPKDVPTFLRNFQWIQGATPKEAGRQIADALEKSRDRESG